MLNTRPATAPNTDKVSHLSVRPAVEHLGEGEKGTFSPVAVPAAKASEVTPFGATCARSMESSDPLISDMPARIAGAQRPAAREELHVASAYVDGSIVLSMAGRLRKLSPPVARQAPSSRSLHRPMQTAPSVHGTFCICTLRSSTHTGPSSIGAPLTRTSNRPS